jgi:membrane-associated phospholipid phosphatase
VGVAAPVLRRRLKLPPAAVLGAGALAPAALCVAVPRSRRRDVAVCVLNMWAYVAAYEMPHDNPERLAERAKVDYPILADRVLGFGVAPTVRLQRAFAKPGRISRFERILIFSHWIWFTTPHASLAYILWRRPDRFPRAAVRMYGTFDIGVMFYWLIPTAPPWWAALNGRFEDGGTVRLRRMMIEYGPEFWGDLWGPLYDVLGGNPLAAMPSLHFATSLMGAHLLSEVGPLAGAVSAAYATTLGLALVYLGEHYAVDLLAGAALTETVRAVAPRLEPIAVRVSGALRALELRASAAG